MYDYDDFELCRHEHYSSRTPWPQQFLRALLDGCCTICDWLLTFVVLFTLLIVGWVYSWLPAKAEPIAKEKQ